jgi:hypothetical protein
MTAPFGFSDQVRAAFRRGDPNATDKQVKSNNVEFWIRLYGNYLQGDLEGLLANLADDVDWHSSASLKVLDLSDNRLVELPRRSGSWRRWRS